MSTQTERSPFLKPPNSSESLLPKPITGTEENHLDNLGSDANTKSTLKRNACEVCRKRKLRCDGDVPSCRRCMRLKHDCTYKESRRKSGPRRGYVKDLETRLGEHSWLISHTRKLLIFLHRQAQAEGLLAKQERGESLAVAIGKDSSGVVANAEFDESLDLTYMDAEFLADDSLHLPDAVPLEYQVNFDSLHPQPEGDLLDGTLVDADVSWAMIELGVDEPLPPQEILDEL